MIGVVDSLLRNSLMSLSSHGEFSTSLSLSAELINDTIVITSAVALESTDALVRPSPRSRLFVSSSSLLHEDVRNRLLVLLDLLFRGADLIDRSRDI